VEGWKVTFAKLPFLIIGQALAIKLICVAISVANGCKCCINSHTTAARNKDMSDEMLSESMAVVAMANQPGALAGGLQIDLDEAFCNGGRVSA
jgi:AhpD family alkylhydroperoxidase